MSHFSEIKKLDGRMPVQHLPLRELKTLTVRCFLIFLAAFSSWTTTFAQTPGCIPYTANYPCVYVANFGPDPNLPGTNNLVTVINAATNSVIGSSIAVGNAGNSGGTQGIAISPDNSVVYVAQSPNGVGIVDTRTNTRTATIAFPGLPSQIVFTRDGAHAWVITRTCGDCISSIQIIDTKSSSIEKSLSSVNNPAAVVNNPAAVAFSPDGTTAYVADACKGLACIDLINTSDLTLKNQITVPFFSYDLFSDNSIATSPDGSLVCVSFEQGPTVFPHYGVACIRASDQTLISGTTFSQIPTTNYGLGITSDGYVYVATTQGIVVVNSGNSSLSGVLQSGVGSNGIAVGPDGSTVYATNFASNQAMQTVSVLRGGLLLATINAGDDPNGIAIMPSSPPTIVTQPSSQTIAYGQSATLSVTATGTPPLSYQWYQGQSGDTSAPIAGATSSSYTTPTQTAATSYWVAVSNPVTLASTGPSATGAPSTTSTISPTILPPTCSLSIQTTSFLTVVATAACIDPQQQQLTTTLDWGQGAPTVANNGNLVATKTYPAVQTPTRYTVTVSSTNTSHLTGNASVPLLLSPAMPPTCSLSIQTTSLLTVQATANCIDPQQELLTTTLDWKEGPPTTANNGNLVATKTYSAVQTTTLYTVTVTSTNTSQLSGNASVPLLLSPPMPVFTGQMVDVSAKVPGQTISGVPAMVSFECVSVLDSNGHMISALALGISCSSNPSVVTLSQAQNVTTIVIETTGAATVLGLRLHHENWYAFLFPVPAFMLLRAKLRTRRMQRFDALRWLAGFAGAMMLSTAISCGGGFKPPTITQTQIQQTQPSATPAGSYQVTVVDNLVGQASSNFVQTTLIVPLTVSPTQ
jgi:YVTN family beta-propeller protein